MEVEPAAVMQEEHVNGLEEEQGVVDDGAAAADANGAAEPEVEEKEQRLYFVRVPRPPMDEAERQRLQAEFQAHLTELKNINARLAAKRDVIRGLRNQMSQAKSLKGSAQPEFEEKLNRLKQLRDLRSQYIDRINAIKNKVKGLDCRSEAELDAKIKEKEDSIRFGSVTLREEKMIVNDISKLRSQRDKIKEYELEKAELGELEANTAKVKAAIEEMDGEFSIIKGERDAASKVMADFYDQLKAAEKDAAKVEEEQRDAVEKKNEAHQALEAAKAEVDRSMADYRENRKFSLQIRDMVAAGEVEAAQELCAQQRDEMMGRLSRDTAFRSEYCKLLAEQRRAPVSELLPESSTAAAAAAAAARGGDKDGRGGRGGRGGDAGPPVKLVPRGKEKAEELIASIMASASTEAAHKRLERPPPDADDEPDYASPAEAAPAAAAAAAKPVVPAKPTAPPKHVENPAAKAAEVFNFKVEVPRVEEVAFVPPVLKVEAPVLSKEQIREEQKAKALEAKLKKEKRAEAADKKRAKAIESKRADEGAAKVTKAAPTQHDSRAAAAAAAAAATSEGEAEEEVTIAERPAAREAAASRSAAPASAAGAAPKSLLGPAAKRPVGKATLLRRLKRFYQNNQTLVVVAAFLVVLVLLILLAASLY